MCVGSRSGLNPGPLGYQALRAATGNCARCPAIRTTLDLVGRLKAAQGAKAARGFRYESQPRRPIKSESSPRQPIQSELQQYAVCCSLTA